MWRIETLCQHSPWRKNGKFELDAVAYWKRAYCSIYWGSQPQPDELLRLSTIAEAASSRLNGGVGGWLPDWKNRWFYSHCVTQRPKHSQKQNHLEFLTDWLGSRVFTVWAAVLAVVMLSVCLPVRPFVRHRRALWQNQTVHCGYLDTTRKGNHSIFLKPSVVGRRRPLPSEICVQTGPPLRNTPTLTGFRL